MAKSVFNATMSIKCFCFPCGNLRFNNIDTREERFQYNRAAANRALFETFVNNCEEVMIPNVYLSLDETLHPTRVNVAFPQHKKGKPEKYRLLLRRFNCAESSYTYSSVLYARKPAG